MKSLLFILIIILTILTSCDSNNKKPQKFSTILTRQRMHTDPHTFKDLRSENCEDYAVLMSATKLAKKLKKPKSWIVSQYQIPLRVDTLSKSSRIIGHAPPGSTCFIIEQSGTWFYLQAPGSNELGWVHQDFVVGIVKQDPETQLPCVG